MQIEVTLKVFNSFQVRTSTLPLCREADILLSCLNSDRLYLYSSITTRLISDSGVWGGADLLIGDYKGVYHKHNHLEFSLDL